MRFSRCHVRSTFRCAAIITAIGLAGCGNSCFVGLINNGNGSFTINAGNPAPTCSLTQVNGMLNAIAVKSTVCETCAPAARVEHIFVTLRSIQLRPSGSDDTNAPDWLELAPQLANEPRQIDLMGNSMPVILVENAIVPAGSYREVRLQFFPGSPTNAEELPAENACEGTRWNCMVMADGRVEAFSLPGDVPELLISSQSIDSGSLVVLPDARLDLQLSLEPHQGSYFSSTVGWKPQNVLVGRAVVVRQRSFEEENSDTN
jgi:Domain of unknown function (DUF4382)